MSGVGHGHDAGHGGPENKRVALLIAVLALMLAFSETLGKSAQTAGLGVIFSLIGFFAPTSVHLF